MNIYSTGVLIKVVNDLPAPQSFFLDRYFTEMTTEESEEIHFDVVSRSRKLAPFVSPVVAGKIVAERGHKTSTFKPAYVKPKTNLSNTKPFKRAVGEKVGGVLNPMQRREMQIADTMQDHLDQITKRLEWMAIQALFSGSVTITGEDYSTQNVDFGRDAALTVALTGASRWGQSGIKPLDDMAAWSLLSLQKSGRPITEYTMTTDVWEVFRADADVKERLDTRRVIDNAMSMNAQSEIGGEYKGTVDGFNIFVYADWYEDDNGAEQPMMAAGSVIGTSKAVEGVRAFGAIQDEEAGLMAMPFFPKSWLEKDPSARILLTQSAPLIVPTVINNSFGATVL